MSMICSAFDDWVDYFNQWRKDLGIRESTLNSCQLMTKFTPVDSEIQFGAFKGGSRWDDALRIPNQQIRDDVIHLLKYQGDAELSAPELHKGLFEDPAPTHDLECVGRVILDEMRHGWQMSYLLVRYFGETGTTEARGLLERSPSAGTRLLGAFNVAVSDWLDFYCHNMFLDRVGKFQLTMLRHSSFKPLAMSTVPMIQEEAFHLYTGFAGLSRVVKAAVVPIDTIQRRINKWAPLGLDMFGVDHSPSSFRFYEWGLKGRIEENDSEPPDAKENNEIARKKYRREMTELLSRLNALIPEGQPHLTLPDTRFNRRIGDYANQPFSTEGEWLSETEYMKHIDNALPNPQDQFAEIMKDPNWILAADEHEKSRLCRE